MKKSLRWIIYGLVGLAFGVADFYIEAVARQFLIYPALLFVGFIWVVPSFCVALYEIKKSDSKSRAVKASILAWVAGVVAYYLVYTSTLALSKTIVSFSMGDILLDIVLWSVAAAMGGAIVGFLTATIYKAWFKKKSNKEEVIG